jgi:hypothetical protein
MQQWQSVTMPGRATNQLVSCKVADVMASDPCAGSQLSISPGLDAELAALDMPNFDLGLDEDAWHPDAQDEPDSGMAIASAAFRIARRDAALVVTGDTVVIYAGPQRCAAATSGASTSTFATPSPCIAPGRRRKYVIVSSWYAAATCWHSGACVPHSLFLLVQ